LALNSQSFFPSWSTSPINTAQVTPTTTIDPQGLTNAARVENVLSGQFGRTFTIVSGATYTNSLWMRRVSGTGVVSITDVNGVDKNCTLTSEWQRFETTTVSSSTVGRVYVRVFTNGDIVEVWGAQLEAGAYQTTYIPTSSASVTRNQDTFTLSNVFTNNLISSAGGTWVMELRNNIPYIRDAFSSSLLLGTTSTLGLSIGHATTGVSQRLAIRKFTSGTGLFPVWITTATTSKIAIKWNGTTIDVFENGVKVVSESSFVGTLMNDLFGSAGDVPRYINSMALYNTPLSDDECIAKTL
jgi:hypothetical protein